MSFGIDDAAAAVHRQRVDEAERELERRRRIAERYAADTDPDEGVTHVTRPARGIRRLLPARRRHGFA
jgi:dTDP-4-amino-4,6-dideoxygalactose transaminase